MPSRPKLGFLHMGERHKKWFRGRERTIEDADVVSEVELERLMQAGDSLERGASDSMGDEPIDGNDGQGGDPGRGLETNSVVGTKDVVSEHHSLGFSSRTGSGTHAWMRGRTSSQQLVLGRTEGVRPRVGGHHHGMDPDHLRNLSSLVFWLGCMGLGAWIFTIMWLVPQRRRAGSPDMLKPAQRTKSGAVKKKRPPSRVTSSKARNV
eukprot:jgi/Botrbrau1/18041/Bobra.0062s0029.1